MKETLKGLITVLLGWLPEKFYGKVILQFENGRIVHMEKTESKKMR